MKDALIAEVASDVLQLRSSIESLEILIKTLESQIATNFDTLQAGLIQTIETIDHDIKETGQEQIYLVKKNLSSFIEKTIEQMLISKSEKIEQIVQNLENQHDLSLKTLKMQFDEVYQNMNKIKKNNFSKSMILILPFAYLLLLIPLVSILFKMNALALF
jgi:hypothetical protein